MEFSTDVIDSLHFYEKNYDIVSSHIISNSTPNRKIILPFEGVQKCRFCDSVFPEVTFRNEAHAIPAALGNKKLFTKYECDTCNSKFGLGIEQDFGTWSKPFRTILGIRGRKGIPSIKEQKDGGWRIDNGVASGLRVTTNVEDTIVRIDENTKSIHFSIPRDPYTPISVVKSLVKMGISVLPEEEISNFSHAKAWILGDEHNKTHFEFPVIRTTQIGPEVLDVISATVLRRKVSVDNVFYCFLILSYSNDTFQVIIPSPERDKHLYGTNIAVVPFPSPSHLMPESRNIPVVSWLEMYGREIIRGDTESFSLKFENMVRTG